MLRLENLSKRYGDTPVFRNLTRHLSPGCWALCDEDSTGKSTLLGMIAGVIPPDSGEIWVEGHRLNDASQQARHRVAWVPADCLQFPALTGRAFLERLASDKHAEVDATVLGLAADLSLESHLDKSFEQMSTGTRRKVYLTAAALGTPAVVVADGPSDGLDANARERVAALFRSWGRDRVVLFASHDAELVRDCGANRLELAGQDSGHA